MLKVLKFKTGNERFFLTGCTHWSHAKDFIYKVRGFNSIEEHDATLKERWNKKITTNDVVFHLGDNIFGEGAKDKFIKLLNELNFKTIYASGGNHTAAFRQLYFEQLYQQFRLQDQEVYPLYWKLTPEKTVVFMPNYYEICVDKNYICLSHYPIISHNAEGQGSWHCHSHCHNRLKFSKKDNKTKRMLEVGIDAFGEPVSYEEVKKIMDSRTIETLDHH